MKSLKLIIAAVMTIALVGCNSVTGLKNFADCKFKFNSVSNVKLADIDLTNKKSYSNFKLTDLATLGVAYAKKELMLDMNVNMVVNNPNEQPAQLDGMDFILWIDDEEMLDGTMNQKVKIEAGEDAVVSLPISMNLYESIKDKKINAMAEFALGLATNKADNSRVKVSVKPFFTIMDKTIKFPSYITIGGDEIMPKGK